MAKSRPKRRRLAPATASATRETREIDLARVTELRRLGLDTMADIARAMGIPKQTMANAHHAVEVKEAFEIGRVLAKVSFLEQYEEAIRGKNGNLSALLIFKGKQHGWTDRQTIDGSIEVGEGAREIVEETIEKLRAKAAAEGSA